MASTLEAPALTGTGTSAPAPRRTGRRAAALASVTFRRTIAIIVFVAVWELAPRLQLVDPIFLPPVSEVVPALWDLAGSGQLWSNTEASLIRALAGAKEGLCFLIGSAQQNFAITDMYAGILTISVLGLVFNYLLVLLERRFTRWRADA